MTWLIVLAVLVVGSIVGRLIHRRTHQSPEPRVHKFLSLDDERGRVETHDLMGDSYGSQVRRSPRSQF